MNRKTFAALGLVLLFVVFTAESCGTDDRIKQNQTALDEQVRTESNQAQLFKAQPPPKLTWSLERDNLIKRFKLMNDRAVNFYMYVFIEGVADPVGYYMVNKVSSVDSQLTNTQQVIKVSSYEKGDFATIPSPAEDGSYGTNGSGVFGFTPEQIYIEHNMHYICSTVPLQFAKPVVRLGLVNSDEARQMLEQSKKIMQQ